MAIPKASSFMIFGSGFAALVGIAAVVALMVLLCRKVLPAKLDGTFGNKFLQGLHDYFNFKKLYIESVLRFLFVLITVIFVVAGVLGIISALFGAFGDLIKVFDYGTHYFGVAVVHFFGGILGSLAVLVLGPVATRLTYEGIMMFILLVKNVIELNGKVKAQENDKEKSGEADKAE